jgi:hypothetical protein
MPTEYSLIGQIIFSKWLFLFDPTPDAVGPVDADKPPSRVGWFGDEFGRALARCAEIGIHSGLLRRDTDRLLVVLGGATMQAAGLDPSMQDTAPLPEEVGYLLDRIAEIGMYAWQVKDPPYDDWFIRPATVLAHLEARLESVQARATNPSPPVSQGTGDGEPDSHHHLASRALAAWCLVGYVLDRSKEKHTANQTVGPSLPALECLGGGARGDDDTLWPEARLLAVNPALHPSWLPSVRETGIQANLEEYLESVQNRIREKHNAAKPPATPAGPNQPKSEIESIARPSVQHSGASPTPPPFNSASPRLFLHRRGSTWCCECPNYTHADDIAWM